MPAPLLYCGDTNLEGPASYLAGLLTHFGWEFQYLPSDVSISREILDRPYSLIVLSDYPAARFDVDLQRIALRQVANGTGLLMIGGWESFHGLGGNWDGTPLGLALPVEIGTGDDRVNFPQPTLLKKIGQADHPTIAGLPWDQPPTVGGLNRVRAKSTSTVVLEAVPFQVIQENQAFTFQPQPSFPALVVGQHGEGRTAAFLSDIAPHWVGGLVDWGASRVTAQAVGAPAIEVGSDYAKFWQQLLAWTGQMV